MSTKENLMFFGDGWYNVERNLENDTCFIWNNHKSFFVINSDEITGLGFLIKSGPLHPVTVTLTIIDATGNVLSSEIHEIGEKERAVEIDVPRGARQCVVENHTFVPSMMTYGSLEDIRSLGVAFVKSVTIHRGPERIETPLDEIERFSNANEGVSVKRGMVSVIFPIYGSFHADHLSLVIASAQAQKDIDIELIVSEEGESPKLKGKLEPSIKYLFKERATKDGRGNFNPGGIRNKAIANSSGEFIYTSDGDTILLDEHFLSKSREILEQNRDMILSRPHMRRLPIDNFEEFRKRIERDGVKKAIASLNLSNEFLATTDSKKREIKVAISNSDGNLRVRTTSMEEFERYTTDPTLKKNEHVIWSDNVHYGGNFLRREQFEEIGGYCEQYINWGSEDIDFQWKLRHMFNMQLFPRIGLFTILHLDHEKRYFLSEIVRRNEGIFSERRRRGVYSAIVEDRERRGSEKIPSGK